MDAERFVRQILVDGIGEAGQRAIGAAPARVGGAALANEVATLYASAAGFAEIVPAAAALDPLVPEEWVVEPEAREALAGARAALREIVAAVAG